MILENKCCPSMEQHIAALVEEWCLFGAELPIIEEDRCDFCFETVDGDCFCAEIKDQQAAYDEWRSVQ